MGMKYKSARRDVYVDLANGAVSVCCVFDSGNCGADWQDIKGIAGSI